jgi:cytochrome P450
VSNVEDRHDLWEPQMRVDPLPTLARLRGEAPVVRLFNPHQGAPEWLVTRYAEAVELLRDPRFVKDPQKLSERGRQRYFRVSELGGLDRHMLFSDPPEHTRLRSLVSKAFTPRRLEALRPKATAIATRLLDDARERGTEADLLVSFAFPLPIAVIAELIGVPLEDQDRFREWTTVLVSPPTDGDFTSLRRMATEFQAYLTEFLALRRRCPRDDLTSALIAAEEQGDQLSPVELMSMIFLLIAAGYETTGNLIGNGAWALLRHPDQFRLLRDDPSLIAGTIEETLRYCGPVTNSTGAFALEETLFAGQVIPAEEMVIASLLSAHHDPARFPEPERFDITRTPTRHLGFGMGIHFCLGAPLARIEAAVALNLLVSRSPELRLAEDPATLRWRDGVFVHGLERLPVRW